MKNKTITDHLGEQYDVLPEVADALVQEGLITPCPECPTGDYSLTGDTSWKDVEKAESDYWCAL